MAGGVDLAGATVIRGVNGQVTWSYYVAAKVHGFSVRLAGDKRTWKLTATLVDPDAYKLAQRPLIFVAPTQRGDWRWPITDMTVTDHTLRATLGPQLP